MTTEVNEIDMMYIDFALKHDGSPVDEETAEAVNESIDRFCAMVQGTGHWLDNDPGVKFICENAPDLKDI